MPAPHHPRVSRAAATASGAGFGTALALLATAVLAAGPAGVKLDGTLGGPAMALSGPTYHITQNLGKLSGSNLFFSFQYFNIATSETALFSTTSSGINDVISRVTGGYASTIDGTIRLQAASGAPNFFFINPDGVTFTSNAVIDVPAAFYVTTANYVKFSDGNFYADPSKTSTLSTLPPEAFGFLGTTRAPVDVMGATLTGAGGGSSALQVVAGDVTIDGGGSFSGIFNGSGDLRVIATGAQAIEVPLSGPVASDDGTVTIKNGGWLATTGGVADAAGNISVSAGSLTLDGDGAPAGARIIGAAGGQGGGAVVLDIAGGATLTNGGLVSTFPQYGASGGALTLQAGSLTLQGSANTLTGLDAHTDSAANGGAVNVNVTGAARITQGASVTSYSQGTGKAGDITFDAGSLTLDGGPSAALTTIESYTTAAGNTGAVSVNVSGPATIANSGEILSTTFAGGSAGDVTVAAGSLSVDGGGSPTLTGVVSVAQQGSTGNAGRLTVTTPGAVSLSDGVILTDTLGAGNAGGLVVAAGTLTIDGGPSGLTTGISSSAEGPSTGNAGPVSITTTGPVTIARGGVIESDTYGRGSAGSVALSAGSLSIDGGDIAVPTGISSSSDAPQAGGAGQVSVTTSGATTVANGGQIRSDTLSAGKAGDVTLRAGSVTVLGGAATSDTTISSDTNGVGANAGRVNVTAGSLDIDGGTSTGRVGIFSDAGLDAFRLGSFAPTGAAGTVSVSVSGSATLANGGQISSDTYGQGNAGDVILTAGTLSILPSSSSTPAGVSTDTNGSSTANGGRVTVSTGTLNINGGGISSNSGDITDTGGPAGTVNVTVSGSAALTNGAYITSNTFSGSNAGDVNVSAGSLSLNAGASPYFTAIASESNGSASANAGHVSVTAGSLSIDGGGIQNAGIDSDSGAINQNGVHSGGAAGTVSVNVTGAVSLTGGGLITSNTYTAGNAGTVIVTAGSVSVDSLNSKPSEISSTAEPISSGNAGQVQVTAGAVSLTNGGVILTNTYGPGKAGDVSVSAGSLTVNGGASSETTGIGSVAAPDARGPAGTVAVSVTGTAQLTNGGIDSQANTGSGGQPGTIRLNAGALVLDSGGFVSVENDATVADPAAIKPTLISIQAGSVQMNNGVITAASTGNVAASSIDISYGQSLHLDPSKISTSAFEGNGGSITINGQGPLWLTQSNITTSVTGTTNGNGGNIRIDAPYLIFDTGAIQANTTARLASGGDITINARAIVPSFESYTLGGALLPFDPAVAGLNVVQAAAPQGISGVLNVTVPTLDLGNSLLALAGVPATPTPLGRGVCQYRPGSSLSLVGRGGLPASARDPLWVDADESANSPAQAGNRLESGQAADRPEPIALIACR